MPTKKRKVPLGIAFLACLGSGMVGHVLADNTASGVVISIGLVMICAAILEGVKNLLDQEVGP